MCRDCYCKNASAKNTGTRSNWEALLQKFYEQNQLCALTGEKLEMGFNTHVDHIMPVARFPELRDDVDNLQWTTAHVNFAKRNMTTQEFLELCKKVIACQTSE
jgi:CRISPR/Cas system Type II protein with McrA/HNH and RuvC-like nuclease domain